MVEVLLHKLDGCSVAILGAYRYFFFNTDVILARGWATKFEFNY